MLQKLTKEWTEPAEDGRSIRNKWTSLSLGVIEKVSAGTKAVFFQYGLVIAIVGFLLGRAMILSELTPFVLPFLAAVYMLKRERAPIAALSLVAGALTGYHGQIGFVIAAIIVYVLLQKVVAKYAKDMTKALPYTVFAASLMTRLGMVFTLEGTVTSYALMMATVEAGLSFILTMIFLQSVPIVTSRKLKQPLRNEEIVCLIILLASVMTGTVGWMIYDMTVEHVLARYLVLAFAFVGGAAIGSTVGVVTGLILSLASVASLYQMSLLAFAGLLGGLLKEGKKVGVGIGLLVGTLLIGLYGEGATQVSITLMESLVAILVFFLTPKSVFTNLARFIPGTIEHSKEQQQYLRKIRDLTAGRVEQFSTLFQTLSNSFHTPAQMSNSEDQEREVDYFLSNVTEKTCQTCFKKERCWVQNFNKTYDSMQRIMTETEEYGEIKDQIFMKDWKKECIKPEKVVHAIRHEHGQYQANQKLKRQVMESRRLVADQLLGVSRVMGDFAKEIQKEKEAHHYQEEQMLDALREVGLEIGHIDIYSLEKGNLEIEMSLSGDNGHGQSEKIIAPILSDLLNETVIVKKEENGFYPNGYSHVSFGSAKQFVVDTGVAHVAKGGAYVSGDCYSTIELGSGKYAIAISDGMGNGERAHLESNETLQLLQKVLQSGIEETVAIKSVNSVLSLRTTDEIFSTLDLAMIDLQDATTRFLKIGSIPSFIKRGSHVIKVEASNLPMGMIQEFDVDVVSEQLKAGDLLVMMSDGIYDAPKHVENKEMWMKRLLSELKTDDPQEIADVILEKIIRDGQGNIDDDMTVIVAKVKRNTPKWSAIPLYKSPKLVKKRGKRKLASS
ncbi:stage II sporulation serine phosphatase for sigma-F activation [Halalkalibacter wakoensis JCM 9140]|uniref:Stage II sporulation protein E n=1 Tax=Halalkalibacter wakoensis JCM 9140 TaxID=1236970 RepID=W4Q6V3_9BACI|nr:stage II sporulation protein E [Halalkalibacter wakoensis]GAE27700.1 stage II sporulation serine phosphatase for sigma-F activation [Halalkalibacter wakoensis JCM 9140]